MWETYKVLYAGICGSDINKLRNSIIDKSACKCLGHEVVCMDSTGSAYVVNPFYCLENCKTCDFESYIYCDKISRLGDGSRLSGYSGYIKAPKWALYEIEDNIAKVGVLVDGAAVVFHGIHILGNKNVKKIAIIGSGSMSILSALILKENCGADVVDLYVKNDDKKKKLSDLFGKKMKFRNISDTEEGEYDLVVEAVGGKQTKTITKAIDIVKNNGILMVLGAFDPSITELLGIRKMFYKQINMFGINSYCKGENDFANAFAWVKDNAETLLKIITDTYKIDSKSVDEDTFFEDVIKEKMIKGCFEYE